MSGPISHNPSVGEILTYRNFNHGVIVAVRVLQVFAAVCVVETLDHANKFRAHVALLYKD